MDISKVRCSQCGADPKIACQHATSSGVVWLCEECKTKILVTEENRRQFYRWLYRRGILNEGSSMLKGGR